MKAARLIVMGTALAAAGGAGFLALSLMHRQPQRQIVQVNNGPKINLEQVLVAAKDIPIGTNIKPSMVRWQEWPQSAVAKGYITKSDPKAMESIKDTIARGSFFEGEPLRESKLVRSGRGYMSAILPAGERAIATSISTNTSAGGFILPNDRVDVIMTRRAKNNQGGDDFITETILQNVRVLAIDQTIEDKNGESVEGRRDCYPAAHAQAGRGPHGCPADGGSPVAYPAFAGRQQVDQDRGRLSPSHGRTRRRYGPRHQIRRCSGCPDRQGWSGSDEVKWRIVPPSCNTKGFEPMRVMMAAAALVSSIAIVALAQLAVATPARATETVGNYLKLSSNAIGTTRRVKVGLNKSLVIDLPGDAHDILVANPDVADAVTRTSRRVYIFAKMVGETNLFIFDAAGKQLLSLDLVIERDITGLEAYIEKYVPGSDVHVEMVNDNVILTGTVPTPQASARAVQLARIFVTGGEATTNAYNNNSQVSSSGSGTTIVFGTDEQRQQSQIVNLLQIEGEDQVHLKVTIAEIQRSVVKQLGIDMAAEAKIAGMTFNLLTDNPFILNKNMSASSFGAMSHDGNSTRRDPACARHDRRHAHAGRADPDGDFR